MYLVLLVHRNFFGHHECRQLLQAEPKHATSHQTHEARLGPAWSRRTNVLVDEICENKYVLQIRGHAFATQNLGKVGLIVHFHHAATLE